ncbi:hypothetical protein [Flavobacterium sp.]|uniref:hypothetical protein n=1 Tax=Flavobacterium sp. TaxID=239 RepID=UPI0026136AA6|nr:hypothetical protein [Flavobacterium sp.]
MKKSIIKISGIAMLLLSTSCSKESCSYVTECTPNEPEGFMVNTMNMDNISNTAAIYKTTFTSNAPIGSDWNDLSLGTNKVVEVIPTRWNKSDIGQVFGIAIDDNNGIYLSASKLYNIDYPVVPFTSSSFGTAGSAGIYKTDVVSLSTIDFVTTENFLNTNTVGRAKIPNADTGLGNIAFDKKNNQLFATNLEDGRIYRIDGTTGIVKSIYDPFVQELTPSAGMVAAGEQLWGIGILEKNNKTYVFFARTLTESIPTFSNSFNGITGTKSIYSIELDSSGEFLANEIGSTKLFVDSSSQPKLEIANVPGTQAKITDIAFSCSGRMLLAERGAPHDSKVLEYINSGSSWIVGSMFYTGDYLTGDNSAGGVDYGDRENLGSFVKDDVVWATANAMNYANNTGVLLYGVQGMSSSGNSPITSANTLTDLFIDYDHVYNNSGTIKGGHGDVEIFDSSCPCNKR